MKSIILGTAALALSAGLAMAAGDTVRLGTEGAYPPFNFLNDAGEVDGFEREVGDELCNRAGMTCEWVTNEWDSMIPNLVSGNYDAIIAGMSITEEREAVIDFTQNYTQPDPSSYVGKTGTAIDPKGALIAAQTGTIQAAHVAGMGATLLEFASPEETLGAVRDGEADAVLADKSFLQPYVQQDAELDFVADDVLLGGGIGMGFRESDTEMRAKFDAAIQSMKDDGTLNALIEKWEVGETF